MKNIPLAVNKRLSEISSNNDIFTEAAKPYQEALIKSGYKHELRFEPSSVDNVRKSRCRNRKVIWFNPPFCKNVATNVAKEFLSLVETCFPPGHILRSTFNRNTVKASYRTMPNMGQLISRHNCKVLSEIRVKENISEGCNCRASAICPLDGKCKTSGVIYQATVTTSSVPSQIETYTGLTICPFKTRYNAHMANFRNRESKTSTTLSQHIWKLKDVGTDFTIKWKILERGGGYNDTTKSCRRCFIE